MPASITTYQNTPITVNVNTLVNGASTGAWNLGGSTITHNNNIGSYAEKTIPSLVIGNTYRITYVISSYTNCNVKVYLGNTAGTVQTSSGTKVEILTLTGLYKKIRFYSSGTATISSYLIEQLVSTVIDAPIALTNLVNNSWTLSFNPILNQWISFHSYLPNNYVSHPQKLLAKQNSSQLYINGLGDFGKYFDSNIKPFIIETIFNEFKTDIKTFDNVRVIMDSENTEVVTNTFFDEAIVYTEDQCSGSISFTPGTNVTRKERNWNFNNFLDITKNISQSIFVSDWNSISSSYPIDKVINVSKIDTSKPWYQRGRMRDRYLAVRFISHNTTRDQLTIKFIITSFRASQR